MLSITLSRRELLSIGALGLGGLTLSGLLRTRALGATVGTELVKDRSVVLLWLGGGPSHIETFDPKMTAPVEIRSVTGEVQTTLPGVTFGGTFPLLAQRAKHLAIIRNLGHKSSDHNAAKQVIQGGLAADAEAAGLILPTNKVPSKIPYMWEGISRIRGLTHPQTGLPTSIYVTAHAVAGDEGKALKIGGEYDDGGTGALGPAYKAFNPADKSDLLTNMRLALPAKRLDDRQALLRGLDRLRRDVDTHAAMEALDYFGQQAVDVLLGGAAKAFDLSQEDAATLDAYDTSGTTMPSNVAERRRKDNRLVFLGRQMLLARRLVEAGAGFVKVSAGGWDHHGANNNITNNVATMFPVQGPAIDKVASAFIDDCQRRGLQDKVLLVICGEMGRTPRLGKHAGRDHWSHITTVALYGGGLKTGQVIGQSDRLAAYPAGNAYTPQHLLATIMHTLFDLGQLRVAPGLPADFVQRIGAVPPIPELV
jgi:hypothetical protein